MKLIIIQKTRTSKKILFNCNKKKKVITLKENDKYEFNDFSFEVSKLDKEYVKINTNEVYSEGSESINLLTDTKEFEIKLNDKITLQTPSTDRGYIYELKFKK